MKTKGFSLYLTTKVKSRYNPTGELKTLCLRVSHGSRGARRPFKSLGIDLFPHEWDSVTLSIKSTAKTRLGTVIFQQYVHRIETIKSKFYDNMVALENGQKSIDQAFADVLGTNAKDLVMPVLMEHSSNKDEIRYFKDYCKVLGRTPENLVWKFFTPNSLTLYANHLRNERGVEESTISSYFKTFSKLYRIGQERGLISQLAPYPKGLTKGFNTAGGRKRFHFDDMVNCLTNSKTSDDLLACAFILLSIHFCGTDRTNWMRLKNNEWFDENAHEYHGGKFKFVRYKRLKEETHESIGNTYFAMHHWYVEPLINLFRYIDKTKSRNEVEYISDFLIGQFTIEPTVDTVKSWYKRRGINKTLSLLNPDGKREVKHNGARATFEFYASKADVDEQTLAFMQGRSIRGSVKHYAVMESRLERIAELHEKAMSKFQMNMLCAILFYQAEAILDKVFYIHKLDTTYPSNIEEALENIYGKTPH